MEQVVKDMLGGGANIDATIRERFSYFPASIDIDWRMSGDTASLGSTLLKYGADPHDVPEGAVLIPLASAAYFHRHGVIIGLSRLKLHKPIGDARRTPVLKAIRWNREALVQTLVQHGADIHAQAANPFTLKDPIGLRCTCCT